MFLGTVKTLEWPIFPGSCGFHTYIHSCIGLLDTSAVETHQNKL